jgi:hypothetical protein
MRPSNDPKTQLARQRARKRKGPIQRGLDQVTKGVKGGAKRADLHRILKSKEFDQWTRTREGQDAYRKVFGTPAQQRARKRRIYGK